MDSEYEFVDPIDFYELIKCLKEKSNERNEKKEMQSPKERS
jgi:hypothetical protein